MTYCQEEIIAALSAAMATLKSLAAAAMAMSTAASPAPPPVSKAVVSRFETRLLLTSKKFPLE